MAKIILCNDFHYPTASAPKDNTDVQLWGDQALPILRAISTHAQNIGAKIIINGDESSHDHDPITHFNNASEIAQITRKISIGRSIGNHEPITNRGKLGFRLPSHFIDMPPSDNVAILICQPKNKITKSETIETYNVNDISESISLSNLNNEHFSTQSFYQYDDGNILSLLNEVQDSNINLLVAGHWAFNRMERGFPRVFDKKRGYSYQDTTDKISKKLSEMDAEKPGRVIAFGAHEHRYASTTSLGFRCDVVPAAVQADIDDIKKPCGIFALATTTPHGWKMSYHQVKITSNDATKFNVKNLSHSDISKYYRRVI